MQGGGCCEGHVGALRLQRSQFLRQVVLMENWRKLGSVELSGWRRIFQTKGIGLSWAKTGRQESIHALLQWEPRACRGEERSGKTLTGISAWEQWNRFEGLSIDFVLVKMTEDCCREGQNLTVRWICFFYFKPACCGFCSLKGYSPCTLARLGKPCPAARILNQGAFVQGDIWILSTCEWLREGGKKLVHPTLRLIISRGYLQD